MEVKTDDFLLNVARGNVYGAKIIHKFGGNHAVTIAMAPVTSTGTYQTPKTAQTLEIVSDNALDTVLGAGAQKIVVTGLDANWNEISEEISLNGITPVTLVNQFTRVYRMRVLESGSYADATVGSHAGIITLRFLGGGLKWAEIELENGFPLSSSEIGAFSVPQGYEAMILHRSLEVEATKLCSIIFFGRQGIDQVVAPFTPMVTDAVLHDVGGLSIDGSPAGASSLFTGPCDIGFMASTSSGTAKVSAAFKILLLKKKL